jgi:hypothetical protein
LFFFCLPINAVDSKFALKEKKEDSALTSRRETTAPARASGDASAFQLFFLVHHFRSVRRGVLSSIVLFAKSRQQRLICDKATNHVVVLGKEETMGACGSCLCCSVNATDKTHTHMHASPSPAHYQHEQCAIVQSHTRTYNGNTAPAAACGRGKERPFGGHSRRDMSAPILHTLHKEDGTCEEQRQCKTHYGALMTQQ